MSIQKVLIEGYYVLNIVPGTEGEKKEISKQLFFECYSVASPFTYVISFNLHKSMWGKYDVPHFKETQRACVTYFRWLIWQMAEPEFVLQSINVESRIHYSTDRADVALGFGEFIVR